jgi:hypothetical protein
MIYVTSSRDFVDYNFFVWGMSAVLEDQRAHTNIDFSADWTTRGYLQEWINKIQPSMEQYGYNIYYRHTPNDFKPGAEDYKVHFTHRHDKIPRNIDKVFTL